MSFDVFLTILIGAIVVIPLACVIKPLGWVLGYFALFLGKLLEFLGKVFSKISPLLLCAAAIFIPLLIFGLIGSIGEKL